MTLKTLKISLVALLVLLLVAGCGKPKEPENVPEMKAKLAKKVKLALWKVDATDEQQDRMDKVLDGLAVDLFAFQQENTSIKRGLITALHAEPVDKPLLESLQKQGVDLFDRYSKRMVVAVMDTSKILNLEQRRELVELWREYEFDE